MSEGERSLSIEDLAARAGVPVRTVRFYIAEGLLPGPGARGKGAAYGEEHLLRLRLARRLAEQRVPLAEIRSRMLGLTRDDVRALLAQEERQAIQLEQASAAPSPAEYISQLLSRARRAREQSASLPPPPPAAPLPPVQREAEPPPKLPLPEQEDVWQRWLLAPGVELHVRSDALRRYHRIIERLRTTAAALFGGNQP